MTSETDAAISLKPDIDDLVPSEASPQPSVGDPANVPSFPKVLRRRLDNFFSDGNISPKADRTDVGQDRAWVSQCWRAAGLLFTRSIRIHGSLSPSTS